MAERGGGGNVCFVENVARPAGWLAVFKRDVEIEYI